jgi:hypothetical protein
MTAQDSGLTVTHDDYGIALSTGTRYQQATDSTVTRIPATTGLEMHAGSGKAVLYADTIEIRGAVELYGDLNSSNSIADAMVEQNFGAAELQSGSADIDAPANERTRLSTLDLVESSPGATIQPVNEDYQYATPGDGWLEITGEDAGGDYFVEVQVEHDTLIGVGNNSSSANSFDPHTIGILRGDKNDSLSWAVVEQCQVTNHSLNDNELVQQFSCYLNHHDADFSYSIFYTNGSDRIRSANLIDLEARKMNKGDLFDQFPPWIDISSAGISGESLSNASPISVTFIMSEETIGFEADDLQVVNGTLADFAASGSNYTATITPESDGECSISVDANAYTDTAENANLPTEFTWTHDTTAPTMTITASEVSDGDTSADATLFLTFTSSESTDDFEEADVSLTNGTLSSFSGSGTTYTATFTPDGEGACAINVGPGPTFKDAAGNNNIAADSFNWTYDATAPTMTITAIEANDGESSPIGTLSLTFTSSEYTTDFEEADISLTNGTLSTLLGDGTNYMATFTPDGEGACTINVANNVFTDAAGNGNTAADEFNWTYTTIGDISTNEN